MLSFSLILQQLAGYGIERPHQILVYNFAVTTQQVFENRGLLQGTAVDFDRKVTTANERDLMKEVRTVAADEMVRGIQNLGFRAQRVAGNTPLPQNALGVTGQFLDVDEGSKARRLIVGFGKGQSRVDVRVQLYGYAPDRSGSKPGAKPTKLLEFEVHSDSGSMPGLIATGPVGIAAAGAVTVSAVAGSAGIGAYESYSSAVGKMTSRSAEQAVDMLSDYFGRHGWISPGNVKQADRQ